MFSLRLKGAHVVALATLLLGCHGSAVEAHETAGKVREVKPVAELIAQRNLTSADVHFEPHAGQQPSGHHDRHHAGEHHHEHDCPHHRYTEPLIREQMAGYLSLPTSTARLSTQTVRRRRLASTAPAPIRIATDFQLTGLSAQHISFVQDQLMPTVVSQLARYLKVNEPVSGNLQLPRVCDQYWDVDGVHVCASVRDYGLCGSYPGAPQHKAEHFGPFETCNCENVGVPCSCTTGAGGAGVAAADFVLYVTSVDLAVCQGQTRAIGGYCSQDPDTGRPLAGFANICPGKVDLEAGMFGQQVDTGVHEVLHGLVFSPSLFDDFQAPEGGKLGEQSVLQDGKIVSPKVTEAVRQHFGCEALAGAGLEDEGGDGTAGSHWDERLFKEEMMCGSGQQSRAMTSDLTLALAEDSGWYTAVYEAATPLAWGRGMGCGFASTEQCGAEGYFCTADAADACTYNYRAGGYCAEDSLLNGCTFVKAYGNNVCWDEAQNIAANTVWGMRFGAGSRCLPEAQGAQFQVETGGYIYTRDPTPGYRPRPAPAPGLPPPRGLPSGHLFGPN